MQNEKVNATPEAPIVDFLIGGVQKGGTSALHSMLSCHPELYLPDVKELHFFDRDTTYQPSAPDYAFYHRYFADKHVNSKCGEATPSYFFTDPVADRVKKYNPSMKWIILLRHPVLRAYSHWNMQRVRGWEKLDFFNALEAETDRLRTLPEKERPRFAYAARGHYAAQIRRLLSFFDLSQCLFIKSQSLYKNSNACLESIVQFLGVTEFDFPELKIRIGDYQTSLSNEQIAELSKRFASDMHETNKLTGVNLEQAIF